MKKQYHLLWLKHIISTLATLIVVSCIPAYSQLTQTIKGKVVDIESQVSLPGAYVTIQNSDPQKSTVSNEKGEFALNNIPVGRYDISISFLGYEPVMLQAVTLTSGKELMLNIEMKESVRKLNEVVVSGHQKNKAINSMAMISARTFSVEETRRYAGGLDDPGRLASVFAGVADGNIESNGIIVRGNAPAGVIYKVEGVEVDNPNHFAGEDFMGGGFVSILNSHVLGNSDFLTGAFPAEYGNALSAVFDMNMRTGNTNKREHAFQVGVMGIDLSSEGPFIKGNEASYLFNYRYSTFGLVKPFLPSEEGLPVYQDLSYKFVFPSKLGTFTLFGSGGLDNYKYGNKNVNREEPYSEKIYIDDYSGTGFTGIKHRFIFGSKTFINTSFLANASFKSNNKMEQWTDFNFYQTERVESTVGKYVLSSYVNRKFGPRHSNRTGFNYSLLFYEILNKEVAELPGPLVQISDYAGNTGLLQVYSQSKIDFTERLAMNVGVNFQYFQLNDNYSVEPRVGFSMGLNPKNFLSIAYGMHSQTQPLNIYFIERNDGERVSYPNKNLEFTKSHHFILGYDLSLSSNLRLKIEPFYQYLYDVPVEPTGSFSILNLVDINEFNNVLVNKGTARNVGIDFTFERFFNKGYYYLATVSVFDSKYKDAQGNEFNTRYNKRFIANILGGKEWKVRKDNYLGINGRLYLNNGDRLSPFDQEATSNEGYVIYNENNAFDNKYPFTYRCDLSVTYTVNRTDCTNIFALQVMNVLSSVVSYGDKYNRNTNRAEIFKTRMVLPSISWKIEF